MGTEQLSDGCRRFLRVAAVAGPVVAVGEVAAAMRTGVAALLPVVEEAIREEALVVRGAVLVFADPRERERLLAEIPGPVLGPLREELGALRRWGALTETEREIAGLVGRGLTNTQASRQVHLSPHTVNYHLRQIFRKLGVRSRAELARLMPRP